MSVVFHYCITSHHKLSNIKQYPFINSQFCRSGIWHCVIGISVQSIMRLKSRGQPDWVFIRGSEGKWICFQMHSFCQKKLVPCCCRTNIPIYLLPIIGAILDPRDYMYSLPCGSLHFLANNNISSTFYVQISEYFYLWPLDLYL